MNCPKCKNPLKETSKLPLKEQRIHRRVQIGHILSLVCPICEVVYRYRVD
jgi:RNase P subunit RPR2